MTMFLPSKYLLNGLEIICWILFLKWRIYNSKTQAFCFSKVMAGGDWGIRGLRHWKGHLDHFENL